MQLRLCGSAQGIDKEMINFQFYIVWAVLEAPIIKILAIFEEQKNCQKGHQLIKPNINVQLAISNDKVSHPTKNVIDHYVFYVFALIFNSNNALVLPLPSSYHYIITYMFFFRLCLEESDSCRQANVRMS